MTRPHLRELLAAALARPWIDDEGTIKTEYEDPDYPKRGRFRIAERVSDDNAAAIVAVMNEAEALLDENERMRAALETIAKRAGTDCVANHRGCCTCDCGDLARAALGGK